MQSACWAPVGTPGGCVTTCATPLLPGLLARHPSSPPVRVMYIPCHRARLTCPPHPLAPTRHPTDLNIHRPEESLSGIRSESNNFSCLFLLSALLCISPLQWWKGFYHCNSRSAEDEAVPVPMKCPLVFLLLLGLSIVCSLVSPQSGLFSNNPAQQWRKQDTWALDSPLSLAQCSAHTNWTIPCSATIFSNPASHEVINDMSHVPVLMT